MQIKVGDKNYAVQKLFDEKQLSQRVASLAEEINHDLGDTEPVVILMVLHGALLFAADLVRSLRMPTEIESVRLRSYHGTQSSGKIELVGQIPKQLAGKNILIVEDIVDSGKSIEFLLHELASVGAKKIKVACLLDKPASHLVDVKPQYVGFSIGKNFVIGYGLDLDGRYRNLPYVAELVEKA